MWSTVSKLREFTASGRFVYRLFFFKTENDNFIKEMKQVVGGLRSLLKTSAKFVRIREQVKTLDCVSIAYRVFADLLSNSPKRSPRFFTRL